MNNGVPVQRVTHQVIAQVPVRREWTIETERFLHFQERKSSTATALGTGRFCSSRWATRNIRAHTNTDIPGCRCNTGSKASIFSSPSPFYFLPCCASSAAPLHGSSHASTVSWGVCEGSVLLRTVTVPGV